MYRKDSFLLGVVGVHGPEVGVVDPCADTLCRRAGACVEITVHFYIREDHQMVRPYRTRASVQLVVKTTRRVLALLSGARLFHS